MKKLFHLSPLIEIDNCEHFKIIGKYEFLEASAEHCKFLYENFLITIKGKTIHIELLKDEIVIIRVEQLNTLEMKKQEKKNEKI